MGNCSNCKFNKKVLINRLLCCRFPPINIQESTVIDGKMQIRAIFPEVQPHWWCGEWKCEGE